MPNPHLKITKADGTREPFKVEKLRRSLRRAGATNEEIHDIVFEVSSGLYDGIRTQEIYHRAFELLRKSELPAAARYSVRRALFGLGPTGFPFERFLARLVEVEGYTTQTGITLEGSCVEHEIDLAAYNETDSFIAEAKFHARPGIKTDLQVVMYCYARFLDLKGKPVCGRDHCGVQEYWVITNTKFTTTAEKYAQCMGLKLLSWDFPRNNNLHDRIQRAGVYPITVLQGLTSSQVATLIDRDVILCRDIIERPHVLRHLHIPERKTQSLIAEAKALLKLDTD